MPSAERLRSEAGAARSFGTPPSRDAILSGRWPSVARSASDSAVRETRTPWKTSPNCRRGLPRRNGPSRACCAAGGAARRPAAGRDRRPGLELYAETCDTGRALRRHAARRRHRARRPCRGDVRQPGGTVAGLSRLRLDRRGDGADQHRLARDATRPHPGKFAGEAAGVAGRSCLRAGDAGRRAADRCARSG